jgi:ABC-type Fe3+-hydroxamate transport system substrate-binding protein
MRDDLGAELVLARPPRRVVSLVPSLTESVALTEPDVLVGATDYCVHPAGLAVTRVGGSKYPDVGRVLALRPDLVLANAEENRREDVVALRTAGVPVWVTFPRTLDEALATLRRMLCCALHLSAPAWLDEAEAAWAGKPEYDLRVAVPVWRRPWTVLGGQTFAGDVLARLGLSNVYGDAPDRYPRLGVHEIRGSGAELVVLPDEPYAFGATDGPEAFPELPCALVSGRHLTWYGPSLAQANAVLTAQLAPEVWIPPTLRA